MEAQTLVVLSLGIGLALSFFRAFATSERPPQIIYVQAEPTRAEGSGCLPLLMLVGLVVGAAIILA